jgi:HlyD family secretion protein
LLWIGALVSVLVALAFFVWQGMTPQVHTLKVTPGSLVSTVVATGPVDAGDRAEVSARVGGLLEQIQVQEGDRVKAGDVLARQNTTALTTAVVAARAEVARQEDNLVQLTRKAQLTAQQAQLQSQMAETRLASARAGLSDQQRQASDRLADAEHALALLRKTLESGRNLGADLTATRRKVEDAPALSPARAAAQAEVDRLAQLQQTQAEQFREQMAQAQVKLEAARAEVARLNDPAGQPAGQVTLAGQDLAQLQLNAELIRVLPEDETAARSGLDSARQALAKAQEDLDAASIKSPISGVVLNNYLKVGEMAAVGSRLFSMASVDPAVVKAKVDESDIGQVAPGQEARVSSAALPGRSYAGKVRRIAPQAVKDGTATVIVVEVAVPNPDGALRPGMNADVEIAVLNRPDVLQVPPGALRGRSLCSPVMSWRPGW